MRNQLLASLLFVAACDSGPPPNQAADANPNNVAAIVADADGPKAGVEVVFVNPDGKVAADLKTDTSGRAEAVIEPGASVTAAVDGLTTVLDAQPGDDLVFGPHADPTPGKDKGTMAISFASQAGATQYTVATPCSQASGAASPVTLPVHDGCGGKATVLFVAGDGNGMLDYAVDKGVAISADSPYKLVSAWKPADSFTLSVSGIDAKQIAPIKVQLATAVGLQTDQATVATSSAATSISLRAALGAQSGLAANIDDAAGKHHQTLLQPIDAQATGATFAVDKDLLAWVTAVSYDAASRTASVTTTTGDTGGLLEIDLAYGTSGAWHVFGKPGASLTLPALPPSLASLAPAASDTVTGGAALIDIGGQTYDTLRLVAPYAIWNYAGHPETTTTQRIRISI